MTLSQKQSRIKTLAEIMVKLEIFNIIAKNEMENFSTEERTAFSNAVVELAHFVELASVGT